MSSFLPLALIPAVFAGAGNGESPEATARWRVYIGTYAQGEEKGIYLLDRYTDDRQKQIMRDIKKAFDPNNILNPDTAIVP